MPTDQRILVIDTGAVWLFAGLFVVTVILWLLVAHALDTLLLLFVAITFGEGIRPIVDWLDRHHVPRPVAVLAIYIVLAVGILGVLGLLLTPLSRQLADFLANLPTYIQRLQSMFQDLQQLASSNPAAQQALGTVRGEISGISAGVATMVLDAPLQAVDFAFKFIELYLMAFFWLTATRQLKGFVVSTFPQQLRPEASKVIAELGHRLGGYLRATAINMAAIAILSGAGLVLLGVPYPLLLAFIAGLAETLPLLGPWVSGAFAVILTLFTGGLVQGGEVVALYLVIHLIEGNTLVPYVTFRLTDLNPLVTILAIAIGGAVLGLVGAVLGVPIALVLQVLALRVLVPGLRHLSGTATRADLERPGWM